MKSQLAAAAVALLCLTEIVAQRAVIGDKESHRARMARKPSKEVCARIARCIPRLLNAPVKDMLALFNKYKTSLLIIGQQSDETLKKEMGGLVKTCGVWESFNTCMKNTNWPYCVDFTKLVQLYRTFLTISADGNAIQESSDEYWDNMDDWEWSESVEEDYQRNITGSDVTLGILTLNTVCKKADIIESEVLCVRDSIFTNYTYLNATSRVKAFERSHCMPRNMPWEDLCPHLKHVVRILGHLFVHSCPKLRDHVKEIVAFIVNTDEAAEHEGCNEGWEQLYDPVYLATMPTYEDYNLGFNDENCNMSAVGYYFSKYYDKYQLPYLAELRVKYQWSDEHIMDGYEGFLPLHPEIKWKPLTTPTPTTSEKTQRPPVRISDPVKLVDEEEGEDGPPVAMIAGIAAGGAVVLIIILVVVVVACKKKSSKEEAPKRVSRDRKASSKGASTSKGGSSAKLASGSGKRPSSSKRGSTSRA